MWKESLKKKKKFSSRTSFPAGASGKEPACQCRRCKRCGFHPWVEKIPWRREWQPTPVFLPGKFHGSRSRAGYRPWGCKESDTAEQLRVPVLPPSKRESCIKSLPLQQVPYAYQLASFSNDPGAFPAVASVLRLWASEFVCHSLNTVLVSHSPQALPDISPCWFPRPDIGLAGLGSPMWGSDLSLLMENLHDCDILPVCGWIHWGYGFWLDCVCAS